MDLLDDAPDVIYVDNEAVFRDALARSDFDTLFIDRCCGDFGHATNAGNRLIARNVVEVVFAPRFPRPAR